MPPVCPCVNQIYIAILSAFCEIVDNDVFLKSRYLKTRESIYKVKRQREKYDNTEVMCSEISCHSKNALISI